MKWIWISTAAFLTSPLLPAHTSISQTIYRSLSISVDQDDDNDGIPDAEDHDDDGDGIDDAVYFEGEGRGRVKIWSIQQNF